MKGKILKVLLNVFLYLIFALLWCAILFVLTLLRVFDTFLDRFADGALLTIFACIAIAGIIITILFRKRMKHKWMMPLCLIIATMPICIRNRRCSRSSFGYWNRRVDCDGYSCDCLTWRQRKTSLHRHSRRSQSTNRRTN